MTDRGGREWSLVIFTVGLELGCGVVVGTAAVEALGGPASSWLRASGVLAFPVVLVAIAASTLHLGRPLRGWRALANCAESRLSREVLLCSLFGGLTAIYSAMWYLNVSGGRVAVGSATTLLGLVAVLASARVYTETAQPFWRSVWVSASFVGATMIFASITTYMVGMTNECAAARIVTATGAIVLILSGMLMLRVFRAASRAHYSGVRSRPVFGSSQRAALGCAAILAGVIPLMQAGFYPELRLAGAMLILLAALVGVTLSRVLMYSVGNQLSRF